MEKRNTILLTVIAIATLLVAVVGATFAYFASNIDTSKGNVDVNVNTSGGKAVFTSAASGDINIKVDSYMMQQHDATQDDNTSNNTTIAALLSNSENINVTLQASEDNKQTKCTYDLVFVWDNESQSNFPNGDSQQDGKEYYPSKYYVRTTSSGSAEIFKELTIQIDQAVYTGGAERGDTSTLITEKNLDTFAKPVNNKITLKADESLTSTSTTVPEKVEYTVTVKFYNLKENQTNLMGKTFKGKVMVDNVKC